MFALSATSGGPNTYETCQGYSQTLNKVKTQLSDFPYRTAEILSQDLHQVFDSEHIPSVFLDIVN